MKFFLKIFLVKAELAACLNDNLVRKTATKQRETVVLPADILEVVCQSVLLEIEVKSKIFSDSQTFISVQELAKLTPNLSLAQQALSYYKLSIKT